MNEAEVTGLVRQLLQADKIIHEQQLGWSWAPPDEGAFLSPHAPAALLEGSAAKGGEGGEGEEKEEDSEALAAKAVQERIRDPRNLGALQLLIDEGGFLLEARTRGMIEKLPKDDQGMVKLESILRALGVVDGMAFDSLLDALSADSSVEARARGMGTRVPGAVEELSKDQRSSALVTPDDVVRRLKAFVETENTAPRAGISGGAARVAGAMRRADKREKDFWARMVNVISEKDTRVWGRLEKQLESYLGLVSERAASLREVGSLQQQNQELRVLLNTYLSSRINEELVIPPSQVI